MSSAQIPFLPPVGLAPGLSKVRSKIRGRPKGAKTVNRSRARADGAYARIYRTGSVGLIDRRTLEGKLLARVRAELFEHVGPNPSIVQRLLVERAAVLHLRLSQIDRKIFDQTEFTEIDNHSTIAWANCLVRTLTALGLRREAAQHSLDDVLAEIDHDDPAPKKPRRGPQSPSRPPPHIGL